MVLIGLAGEPSSGLTQFANYFSQHHHFTPIDLREKTDLDEDFYKNTLKEGYHKHILIFPINDLTQYELLSQKYYFKLAYLYCSESQRIKNHRKKYNQELQTSSPILELIQKSDYLIKNDGDIHQLSSQIQKMHIDFNFRPDFDRYFVNLAKIIKTRSNCIKRSVGVIVVKDKRIMATGYNGTPQGMVNCYEGGCERCCGNARSGEALDECFCVHAEENAILEIGIQNMKNSTVYTTTFPCLMCTKLLISAKVARVIYCEDYNTNKSEKFFRQAGIPIQYIP